MAYVRYKQIMIRDNDGNIKPLVLNDGNNSFVVLNELKEGFIPLQDIAKALRYPISQRFFKIFLLHEDETIKMDITDYVKINGSLEKTYQQGQTRNLNLTLINTDNIWNPTPYHGKLFANTKFLLQLGVQVNNTYYWRDEGVFVCLDPDLRNESSDKTISIQLHDKFALVDGTISGVVEEQYEIPRGTNIFKAVRDLLSISRDRLGNPYDHKPIVFPEKYRDSVTSYTIHKDVNSNIGEILIDLANMISCDIFYDESGYLTFRDILNDIDIHNREVKWIYSLDESETFQVNRQDKWSEIKNRIIVLGANINGALCRGEAENNNPGSKYNINGNFGIHTEVIEDNLINSNTFCQQRAQYELQKNMLKWTSINFSSIYIPHLKPQDLVMWSFKDYGYVNEYFVVQSVTIPLNPVELMSVNVVALEELPIKM